MSTVADCEHCGHTFEVAGALTGGITNCPECGMATEVGGLNDPLWRLSQLGGLLLAAGIGGGCYVYLGAAAGWIAGIVSALGLWLISRGF